MGLSLTLRIVLGLGSLHDCMFATSHVMVGLSGSKLSMERSSRQRRYEIYDLPFAKEQTHTTHYRSEKWPRVFNTLSPMLLVQKVHYTSPRHVSYQLDGTKLTIVTLCLSCETSSVDLTC